MTIVLLASFARAAKKAALAQREREALILTLENNPAAGDLIPGAGGARKLRVAREGGGKSGGYRVITYFGGGTMPVYLIDVYAKNVKSDLTADERKTVKALCKELLKVHKDEKQ
ncbi:MAG: type II toxin-antitoxin system RelE/ParE family toxin [Micropepsaceae bacterium]